MRLTRRLLLTGALAGLAWPVRADGPVTSLRPQARPVPQPPPRLADLLDAAELSGELGLIVVDATTGRVIEARGSGRLMAPASTAKTITALYALATLGPDYRFRTRLIGTGPVVDGTLQGDLILAGGGDPVLSTDHLAGMARSLRDGGVRSIAGAFRVWAGALPQLFQIDPDQQVHLGYNPAIGGLNLNFNRVHFGWEPAGGGDWRVTMDARTELYVPAVTMARMRIVDRDLPIYTYAAQGDTDRWTVARSALVEAGSRWLPVRHPAAYAAEVFAIMAAAQGIRLGQAQPLEVLPAGTMLVSHASDRLETLIRDMLEFSTNLTAEVLGLTASLARGGQPQTVADSAAMMDIWAAERLGARIGFVDHSGLGDGSRATPAQMVGALVVAHAGGQLPGLLKTITLLDAQGDALPDPPATVLAKTGTLNFVSTLAGYVRRPGGGDLAFAIYAADPARRAQAKAAAVEVPDGARPWNRRARALQQVVLQRWATLDD